ncbi:hypothetical protein CATMIT_01980, partial [Catenibacterium mitsuokai DSM 15897]
PAVVDRLRGGLRRAGAEHERGQRPSRAVRQDPGRQPVDLADLGADHPGPGVGGAALADRAGPDRPSTGDPVAGRARRGAAARGAHVLHQLDPRLVRSAAGLRHGGADEPAQQRDDGLDDRRRRARGGAVRAHARARAPAAAGRGASGALAAGGAEREAAPALPVQHPQLDRRTGAQ